MEEGDRTLRTAALRLPLMLIDRRQVRYERAVGKIRPLGQMIDPVQDGRPHRVEEHFVGVCVELAGGKSSGSRQPAQRIRQPRTETGKIVVSDHT